MKNYSYKDNHLNIVNKPPRIPVQGITRVMRHCLILQSTSKKYNKPEMCT